MADPTGIALEIVFDEVFTLIKRAVVTIYMFDSSFRKLEATFRQIEPLFQDMDELEELLGRHGTELDQIRELIEKGRTLVSKCSQVGRFNFRGKLFYSRELKNWDEDLRSSFGITLQGITARDTMETLLTVKRLVSYVKKLLRGQASSGGVVNSGEGGGGGGYYGKLVDPKAPDFMVGMDKQYKEVKSRLLRKGVSVIVVSGPGGCGKTTMVEQIYNDPAIKGNFKRNAFYIKVSRSFDAVSIIQEMLHMKRSDALNIQSEDDAFRELEKLLDEVGQSPILLVLDDVWSKRNPSSSMTSESESLLKKFVLRKDKRDYKILVTSRFGFPCFGSPIRLGKLKHKDAEKVFLHAATPHNGSNLPTDKDLIKQIVKCCKGSPLALTVIGSLLCGRQISIWRSTLHSLSEDGASILDWDSEIFGRNRKILDCFSKTFNDLSSTIMEHFLDLGSFPEDHKIPACTLVDIWTELYHPDGEVHARALLDELSDRSLVNLARKGNDGDEDDWYEEQFAMQHDLLRQLAIRHSSQGPINERRRLMLHLRRNAFPRWWTEQTEHPTNARILSISTDEKFSSEWPDMEVPAVEAVVLNFRARKYTLPDFMGKMTKLKALIVANNSFHHAELTNFSLLTSLFCLKRIRLERIKIPFLTMTNTRLDNLEKLTLFMCEFSKEGLATENWNSVALPKLLEVNVMYGKNLVKLPDGFCDVTSLRKLSITNCPDLVELPPNIGSLLNLEILRLNTCTKLQELPESIGSLQSLTLLDISDCIRVEDFPNEIGKLQNLKKFHMKGMLNLSMLPSSFTDLCCLEKVTCHKLKAGLWNPFKQYMTNLTVEVIEEEPNLDWLRT